jgi:hypothetical protein
MAGVLTGITMGAVEAVWSEQARAPLPAAVMQAPGAKMPGDSYPSAAGTGSKPRPPVNVVVLIIEPRRVVNAQIVAASFSASAVQRGIIVRA